jgi:hypothetical protein
VNRLVAEQDREITKPRVNEKLPVI